MRSFRLILGLLPGIALAACLDQATDEGPTGPAEVATAVSARGAIIAQSLCAPCHGATYAGGAYEGVECPSLSIVKTYTPAQFDALLAAGVEASGAQTNGYMTATRDLSQQDRDAVHQYLKNYYDQ